jgi:hypothetical protein
MPELAGLFGQRRHQLGIGVTEGIDGDARPEIEIALAVLGEQPGPLAANEGDIRPFIGGKHGGKHGTIPLSGGQLIRLPGGQNKLWQTCISSESASTHLGTEHLANLT